MRREVANLESSIQPGVVINKDLLQKKGRDSDSSATDVSEDEAGEDDSSIPKDDSSDDTLKKQLLERLKLKQAEEEAASATGTPIVTTSTNLAVAEKEAPISSAVEDKKSEGDEDMDDKEVEGDAVDMFAESGDEKDKEQQPKKVPEEKVIVDNSTEKEVDQAVADSENEKNVKELEPVPSETVKVEEETEKEAVAKDTSTGGAIDASTAGAVEISTGSAVDTLKSLAEIRNRMEEMSREELEAALKDLPSKDNTEDGRTTPFHLRDIFVPFKSLTEFVDNKRVLYKQVFRTINKKEFKKMLPKYLRVIF